MRTLVRNKIDVEHQPDLSELKPLESVIVSIRYAYYKSSINQKKLNKKRAENLAERMKAINDLKRVLLSRFSKIFKEDANKYKSATLTIDRMYENIIEDTLNSADFFSYDLEIVEENPDYLVSFPNLPIKIKVRRKGM